MLIAAETQFEAGKEPLVELLDRLQGALANSHAPGGGFVVTLEEDPVLRVSSVERALRRFPELGHFVGFVRRPGQTEPHREIGNDAGSPAAGEVVPFATLRGIAAGVPRAYPFSAFKVRFTSDAFGPRAALPYQRGLRRGLALPGVRVLDLAGGSGRHRSISATVVLDADPTVATLPMVPASVRDTLAVCGRAETTDHILIGDHASDAADAAREVAKSFVSRMEEVIERAALPHALPPVAAYQGIYPGTTGPRRPELLRCFRPLRYGCKGGTGDFELLQRTASNTTVRVNVDCGTWRRSVDATYDVMGLGWGVTLALPLSPGDVWHLNHPLLDGKEWTAVVENLAALVGELDRSLVPAIEAVTGPSPAWYHPRTTGMGIFEAKAWLREYHDSDRRSVGG